MTQTNTINLDDCWLWARAISSNGYGTIGRNTLAHKAIYEAYFGEVPEGLELDHLCEVTICVNPDHLEAVTHRENNLRHFHRRTHCKKGHEVASAGYYIFHKRRNISKNNPTGESRECKACIKARVHPSQDK